MAVPRLAPHTFRQPGLDLMNPQSVLQIPSSERDEVFIECEITDPPSMAGRTVYLRIPAPQVVAMMTTCKRAAIAARVGIGSRHLNER